MFSPDQYDLIDFGEGRKLERFGDYVLDRPAPAAEGAAKRSLPAWQSAVARYHRTDSRQGHWSPAAVLPAQWHISCETGKFELKATPFGHVGLFPEQAAFWPWIVQQIYRSRQPLKVLNLFAYTGGATLAAARAGAEVVHVDAARNVVQWARRNAELSGMSQAPIRWITEDARKFVQRELKRRNRYHAVILDPPSYGHGPKGEAWKLVDHLVELLCLCGELTRNHPHFVLLTCHSPGFGPQALEACLADARLGHGYGAIDAFPMMIRAADGRQLPAGTAAHWAR